MVKRAKLAEALKWKKGAHMIPVKRFVTLPVQDKHLFRCLLSNETNEPHPLTVVGKHTQRGRLTFVSMFTVGKRYFWLKFNFPYPVQMS